MGLNGVNWEKLYPQIPIYLYISIKYNAPKRFEMRWGKTSVWLSVNETPRFIILSLVLCKDHSLNVFAEILLQNRQIILR